MFDIYSERARQVIFVARLKAGQRGAAVIDVDDILVALIIEDQKMGKGLWELLGHPGPLHGFPFKAQPPFFSAEVASDLLRRIEEVLSRSQAIAISAELPISPGVEQMFSGAIGFRDRFQHSHVEPLHLLAAALADESSQGARILQQAGITQENVLEAIRGENKS
jgi:ATP-dependent Clp protease ATP-binding subunit ClpC